MTICQFFAKGNCKFGDRCRFEHARETCQFFLNGNCRYGDRCNKRHDYTALNRGRQKVNLVGQPWTNQNSFAPLATSGGRYDSNKHNNFESSDGDSLEKAVQLIQSNIQSWESGKLWPLSCFGYSAQKPCLPGLVDYSPEELRVAAYEAMKNNTASNYISTVASLMQQSRSRRKELETVTVGTLKHQTESLQPEATVNQFAIQAQHSAPSMGLMGNNGTSAIPRDLTFAGNNQLGIISPFWPAGTGNQIQGTLNPLLGHDSMSTEVKTTANLSNNAFLNPQPSMQIDQLPRHSDGVLHGNSFTSITPGNSNGSVVLEKDSVQNVSLLPTKGVADCNMLNQKRLTLSEKDTLAFKADSFTLGQIPELPPPPELCFGN